jgi:LysR family transcriptional regulator, glycine cleavage system transcriptional activator
MPFRPTLLPHFGVFAAAARHQNFAHAAEELHLTASAVSHHVRRLEATLGAALFQRHARGVSLTAEGRALADAANGALADLYAAFSAVRCEARDIVPLRISTLHSLAYCWIIPRLSRFTAAYPHIRVNIEAGTALARLDDAGPHLAVRHGPGHWPGLTAHHLMDDYLFPVAAPTLPGIAAVTEPAHIARLPLVADHASQGWPDWFRAAGVRGARLPQMHSFTDSTDAMQAAICGIGAALGRTHIAAPYIASGKLVRLVGPALKGRFAYYAVHPSHRRPNAEAAAFIEWLRQEAARGASEDIAATPKPARRARAGRRNKHPVARLASG